MVSAELPWGVQKPLPASSIDYGILPGKFAAQSLLTEIFAVFDRKLALLAEEPVERVLNKTLKKGEDTYLDNLIRTLHGFCQSCLPSILGVLLKWYDHQQSVRLSADSTTTESKERFAKRLLAVDYLFCIVLIDVLPQIHFHPDSCDEHVKKIVKLSFYQIVFRDLSAFGGMVNYNNSMIVSDTFAEVLGVLSASHFKLIQDTFFTHLNELKAESPPNTNRIIHLLMAMKFFRIKLTLPEIERGAEFLDKLGSYFLDVDPKQKDIKHAVAGLLVEILLPVAATIKTEANIPSLIAFVDKLYGPTYELVNKRQHKMAAYPLLTCLLCISQAKFFFNNWTQFLNATLAQLKNKDSKLSRVALESLYRLLWVYIIRNNCEGNTATRSKLETICGSLFPKGNRSVVPREAPLNIFVKIIHFIAQQKLDFAFKEIIYDLLGCNRSPRSMTLYPERMNIGIRALMVIADGLQQKEGPPGMPRSLGPLASGTIQRNKKTYITRPLTADVARSIGLEQYYLQCRKAFDSILRMLDVQVGRPLMLTQVQTRGKEPNEILGGDTKPKLDLFRTCVAAIPRLLPDAMTHQDLIELLTRLTVHMDDELRAMACQTLQNLLTECAEWREDIIMIYLTFITTQVQDTFPVLFEGSVRLLMQLLCMWKSAIQMDKKKGDTETPQQTPQQAQSPPTNHVANFVNPAAPRTTSLHASPMVASSLGLAAGAASRIFGHTSGAASEGGAPNRTQVELNPQNHVVTVSSATALHSVEGFALTLLCQIRTQPKKIAVQLMKEAKQIYALLGITSTDALVINVLDEATPYVVEKYIEHVPWNERQNWAKDFSSAYEKISGIVTDNCLVNADKGNEYMQWDPWACALSGYCEDRFLLSQCSQAVAFAWPVLVSRWSVCNSFVDPNNPQNESRNSLLRTSKSKASAVGICGEALTQESYLALWQKYFVLCCALAPPNSNKRLVRSFSPNTGIESDFLRGMTRSTISSISSKTSVSSHVMSVQQFFQKIVAMLRWDHMTDMRDTVVLGIGSTNSFVFELLLEELRPLLRDAQERKVESNVRRRKRKDLLRLQLTRMFEVAIFRGSLESSGLVDTQSGQLSSLMLDFLDSIKHSTENDQDRDTVILTSLRLHFAKTITLLVNSIHPDRRRNLLPSEKKQNWYSLFTSWGSRTIALNERRRESDVGTYVEQKAVHALCALLCCGPIFEAQKSLGDDGYLYGWLEALVCSSHHTVQSVCEETLSMLLHLNDQNIQLLDWTIQMCYTKSNVVGARCFKALVMLFSRREYPCDFVCLFVLCQMFIEDASDPEISAMATQLLHLLKKQFLDESPTVLPRPSSTSEVLETTVIPRVMANLCTGEKFSKGHLAISRQLAKDYSQLTMPIFSEVCSRIDSARSFRQATLLSLLIPWIENIELVDSNAYLTEPATLTEEKEDTVPLGGSEEATQLVLNNLLYMSITLASEHDAEVGILWKCLASTRDSNLQIIIHYLFVMMVLSPETLIPPAKRIVQHLMQANGIRLVELLMENLIGSNEQFKQMLSRSDMAPYYRWICPAPQSPTEEEPTLALEPQERMVRSDPYQLPMPAYGGHYSNLLGQLPPTSQPLLTFSRSNLSLFLLSDLIGTEFPGIEWRLHVPVILHIAVLGLDSPRSFVCRYSKESIINLCLLVAAQSVGLSSVANIILQNRLGASSCSVVSSPATGAARGETPTFAAIRHAEYRTMLLQSNAIFSSSAELLQAIVFCLSDQPERPLWAHEEAGPRQWKLESAEQLGCMARHLAEFFLQNPMDVCGPPLVVRWTDIAMKQALGNPNRHIVGRCLQIAAALCQSPREWIAPLVSRIAECVVDSHEENQTLVTYLMLYLHQTVSYLASTSKPADHLRSAAAGGHSRSISYTPDLLRQSITHQSPVSGHSRVPHFERHSMMVDTEMLAAATSQFQSQGSTDMPSPISSPSGLTRSKSATTLNSEHSPIEQEHITALVQLLAICVAMLESPIDHEYLLALTLLEKTFEVAGAAKKEALESLAVMLKQMDWKPFPGIVGLLSKGTVIAYGYETSIGLLVKSIDLLDASVIASPNAFSLIVVSIVPHCLLHFDAPTELCINAAEVVAQYCSANIPDMTDSELSPSDHPLHNLATMMRQYAEHVFSRDRFQWTKCVINYLVDAMKPDIAQLIVLLAEMLERSAFVLHVYLLHMIYLLVSHGDLNDASPIPINAQVIRIVTRHVQGVNWKEAARVLKSVVDQWNSISGGTSTSTLNDNYDRMSIDVDLSKPVFDKASPQTLRRANGISLLPATSATFTGDSLKRQANQQNKVREHLVGILTASGMKVRLPQSSSIVLSQSSSDLRQLHHELTIGGDANSTTQQATLHSAFNSSEQISHPDDLEALSASSTAIGDHNSITTDSFPRVFKEFDFLEAEHDSISESAESCFNWLSTIRPRSMSNTEDLNESGGGAPTITGGDDEDYNAADDEEEDEDDDENQDDVDGDDEDEDTVRSKVKMMPRGSAGKRNNFNRRAAAMRRHKVTVGALPLKGHPEHEGRPLSPASDSNEVSSDRTPHQSDGERDRRSESSSGSEDEIDDDELDRDDEELEASDLKSVKSEVRDEEMEEADDEAEATKTAILIGSESEPRLESGAGSTTEGGLTEEMLFLSETTSSIKCHSEISTLSEMRERALQKRASPLILECNHHPSGQVEQLWIATLSEVNNDVDGEATSYAILLFSQLFRECCSKLSGLLRDASHLLSVSGAPSPRNTNFHFSHSLEVLMKVTECPFLFVTSQFLRASNMLQTEKFSLYELREHFETFAERKEHCIRALNAVKSSVKLLMIGGSGGLSANQELDLCRSLQKLFFQLMLMSERLQAMISAIAQSTNAQEFDLSPAVLGLQRDLLQHVANDCGSHESGSVSSLTKSGISTGEQHADSLVLQLANKNYGHALNTLRHLRSQQGAEFGCCDTMDVEVLLMQFCRSHTFRAWAVVGSMQALNSNCTLLKETNMQLASLVRTLQTDANACLSNTRSSRVSSVTESMFTTSLH